MLTVRVKDGAKGFDGMKRRRGKVDEPDSADGDVFQIKDKLLTNEIQIKTNIKEHKRLKIDAPDNVMTAEQQFSPRWMEKVSPENYEEQEVDTGGMSDQVALSDINPVTGAKKVSVMTAAGEIEAQFAKAAAKADAEAKSNSKPNDEGNDTPKKNDEEVI